MWEATFVRLKDNEGNLSEEVLKAQYNDDTEDFIVYFGDGTNRTLGWDDLEECREDGTLFDEIPEDATFCLTPLSCFAEALADAHIVECAWEECEDKNFRNAYYILEEWFRSNGYIVDASGNAKECINPEPPKDLFVKVVNVFYPDASSDQKDVAWEMFIKHMDFQGNLGPEDDEK